MKSIPAFRKPGIRKYGSLLALAGLITLSTSALQARSLPSESWLMPFDVNQKYPPVVDNPDEPLPTQQQIYEFAWQSFIALNWPYQEGGLRGRPDTSADPAPIENNADPMPAVVWETYMTPGTVFVDPTAWDVKWRLPEFGDLEETYRDLNPPSYDGAASSNASFAPGLNQPYTHANVPTGPVVDQNKNYLRFEVTLNRAYFDYIRQFSYFDADTQERVVTNYLEYAWNEGEAPPAVESRYEIPRYFQPLPTGLEFYLEGLPDYAKQGLVEVKAAWKQLKLGGDNPDVPGRYFRRMMRFPQPDGTMSDPVLAGLVGFHIHRVTPFGHLPSTFEHVDNVELLSQANDPLPMPGTPSLNPGSGSNSPPPYPNGYEVNGQSGLPGLIPDAFVEGDELPPVNERPEINVSRVTPIPYEVRQVNRKYQRMLRNSVWRYYQLVGTQNLSVADSNDYLGPGVPGPQYSNTQNLVNTTLESYTQRGWSCAGCHINAFPQGVKAYPPFEPRFERLHVMSFLLLNAKSSEQERR